MLSLVVIALDEEDRIERCLRSVPYASEVLVLDSGSSDRTVACAAAFGATVVSVDWPGHVAQKNRGLELARQPWVLSLDADEWLSDEASDALQRALRNPGDADGFRFARCSEWLGRPIRHGRWYPDRKTRVVRRKRGRWAGDDPHDQLQVDGPVVDLSGDIVHVPYRDLAEHLATIEKYSQIHAASLHARGVKAHVWDVALRPPLHFVDAYLLRRGFLDGGAGLAVAGLGSAHVLKKWSRLRALGRR